MEYTALPHYWVNHLGFLIRKRLVQRFTRHGHRITAEEWAVLLILQSHDGMNATALSDQTLRDKTTMTRLIDKMVAKDLVLRRPDPKDRRAVRLYLTDHGHATFGKLALVAQDLIAGSLTGISQADLDITISTLSKMTANLKPITAPKKGT